MSLGLCMSCLLDLLYIRNVCLSEVTEISPINFSRNFVVLCFILGLHGSFSVSFCIWCKGRIKVCMYVCMYVVCIFEYEIVLAPIVEKNYLVTFELTLYLCQRSTDHLCVGLFLNFLFCSIDLCFYLFTNGRLSRLLFL